MARKIGKLAKRYSRALLGAVREVSKGSSEAVAVTDVARQLDGFARVWREDPSLSSFVLNPMFDAISREKALEQVCEVAQMPDVAKNFIKVLFVRGRISALPEISSAFRELADEESGIIQVNVTTAREVSAEEQGEIEAKIASKVDGEPIFSWRIDGELLGGLVVKYGGRVIDGSLIGQLGRLERMLVRQYSMESN